MAQCPKLTMLILPIVCGALLLLIVLAMLVTGKFYSKKKCGIVAKEDAPGEYKCWCGLLGFCGTVALVIGIVLGD